jgi:hypothetical protein
MAGKIINTLRPVIIHDIVDARVVCSAAIGFGNQVTMWTASGALFYLGPAWIIEIWRHVRREFPELIINTVIDCGNDPGNALSAIRSGAEGVALNAKPSVKKKIRQIASARNVMIWKCPNRILDLGKCSNKEACCKEWFGID